MAPTLYRDSGYSLTHLVEAIKHGEIALPEIQRPFVWKASKVRDLFDSMYRGYPVGTLMFWETGAGVGARQVGGGESDRVARLLIVDGQQRLTSLYSVLTGQSVLTKSFEEKRIRLAFRPADESFEVTDAAIERDPEFIPDISVLWDGSYKSEVREFERRLEDARDEELTHDAADFLENRIDRVRDLRDFRFQVIELSEKANEEQVADIFVRINSEGVKLNQADFILTLMSVHWDKGRKELEAFARAAVDAKIQGASPKNVFIDPSPDQMLRVSIGVAFRRGRLQNVYNILRGKDLESGEIQTERRDEQFSDLRIAQENVLDLQNWHEFLKCLTQAGFRSRKMISSENAVIFTYIIWLIGRHEFNIDTKTLRNVIARWFFMAHTTGRYTGSAETQIESDLNRIGGLPNRDGDAFAAELDRIVQSNFTHDYWEINLPNRLDSSSSRSPSLHSYWAALNLLDAELLFSEMRVREIFDPVGAVPRSIERHHLFPKAFLAANGITVTRQVNAIANMAFLDWTDNAEIGADDPAIYWDEMTAALSPDQLERQTFWHALPTGWPHLEYQDFLEKRRHLLAKVVEAGFSTLWADHTPTSTGVSVDLGELIELGESQNVEFKSTARWNVHTKGHDKKMEHVIVKTVTGFLNAEGGRLLVGVRDDGSIYGLDSDYTTLGERGNRDGFELWLRQMLDSQLSIETAGLVRVSFDTIGDHDVCIVTVGTSGKPVFTKPLEGGSGYSDFWVRVGNATKQLHGDDLMAYRESHWG